MFATIYIYVLLLEFQHMFAKNLCMFLFLNELLRSKVKNGKKVKKHYDHIRTASIKKLNWPNSQRLGNLGWTGICGPSQISGFCERRKTKFTRVSLRNNHKVAAPLQPLFGKVSSRNVVFPNLAFSESPTHSVDSIAFNTTLCNNF